MGAAAGGAVHRGGRASAGVGESRSRQHLVGVGVVGPGVRRAARAQGGAGPASGLRPLEVPEAYKQAPRRVLGLDGQIRDTG